MDVTVTGRKIDIGDALRSHVEERVRAAIGKYFDRPTEAAVTLSRDAHLFICDCMTHLSTGLTAQASAEGDDPYVACDAAIARLEKQLRRYKRRLRDHHRRRKEPVERVEATAYLLGGDAEEIVDESVAEAASETTQLDAAPPAAAAGEELWAPAIVAESAASLPSISVGEAVMQLELGAQPFLLFWNDGAGRVNLVYRRDDGHIGWIDPRPAQT